MVHNPLMRKRIIYFLLLFSLYPLHITAQRIDNTSSTNHTDSKSYIRFYYDNDFFTATDDYYTQGILLELVHPSLKKFPLTRLLLTPKGSTTKYGVAIEHNGFTPTSIRHPEIIIGDRPFAAYLMLKTFSIANNPTGKSKISSSISLGIIGPAAGGEWMQKSIHEALENIEPLGWSNQIQNDFIINYELGYERRLISYKRLLSVNANAAARMGTLSDKANAGATIMLGHFNSSFSSSNVNEQSSTTSSQNKFSFCFYTQPLINVIAYDATLQGGVFNRNNPYTIKAEDISRATFQNNFGVTLSYGKIYLQYNQTFLTKEFSTGQKHAYGGVRIGVVF
jgi:lipid A 3-O-deacylase